MHAAVSKTIRILVRLSILVGIVAGLGASALWAQRYWQQRNKPQFRTAKITTGDITSVVNSTGEVKPVLSISVGSFVSGPIKSLHVDFNDHVKQGQLLAEIDPRIYQAAVEGDKHLIRARSNGDAFGVVAVFQQAGLRQQASIRCQLIQAV